MTPSTAASRAHPSILPERSGCYSVFEGGIIERCKTRVRVAKLLVVLCAAQGCGSSGERMGETGTGGSSHAGAGGEGAIDAATGTGSADAATSDPPAMLQPVTTFYGRMDIEVSKNRVTPTGMVRLEGEWQGVEIISGEMLVVGFAYGAPYWVQVITDPRTLEGSVQEEITASGSFKFPGDFIATQEGLSHSRFDFYARSGSVPLDTKVVLENLDVLEKDARSDRQRGRGRPVAVFLRGVFLYL